MAADNAPDSAALHGLDWTVALRTTDGDVDLLRQIAQAFLEECGEHQDSLRAAVAAGDAAKTRLEAHLLKGVTSNFGAGGARNAAERLETMGRHGDLTGAAACLAVLEEQLRLLVGELTAFVNGRVLGPPS